MDNPLPPPRHFDVKRKKVSLEMTPYYMLERKAVAASLQLREGEEQRE